MIVESKIEKPKSKIGMRADPKWLNLELPGSPVPWTTAAVGHGENLNRRFCNPINYAIGETAEEIPLRSVQVHRPSLRSALHLTDRVIERSEEHTSELQSPDHLVCRLLLEKKKEAARLVDSDERHDNATLDERFSLLFRDGCF